MTRSRPIGPVLLAVLALTSPDGAGARAPQRTEPLHVAFTASMFAGVSLNDAKAAIGVWASTIARTQGGEIAPTTEIYPDVAALARAMDAGSVHLASVSIPEFRQLGRPRFGTHLIGGRRGRWREEFLLLVRQGGFKSLSELKGKTLVVADGIGRHMSEAWLDANLLAEGLGPAARHFASVTRAAKPSRTLLPVFFGQQAACLSTRYGYELMIELNPQLGQGLTALATSPPLAHGVMLFDHNYAPSIRAHVLNSLLTLHQTPRGQQILNMFGLDNLREAAPGDLASALDVLARLDELSRTGR